jgi:tRNA(adenine34) deaminase
MRKNSGNQQSQHAKMQVLDESIMRQCLALARAAEKKGEVPVAAIVVDSSGTIIAKAGNIRESKKTVLGHAELACLQRACKKLDSWRLANCTMYVTLEPCTMCAAAIMQARISRIVFGAYDPKSGALGSVVDLSLAKHLHHKIEVHGGVLETECSLMLKDFFKKRRQDKVDQKAAK